MPRMSRPPTPGQWSSISKALLVLRAFVDHQDQWGVKELATAIGQPVSSTHRLLQILRAEGLVDWSAESQKYFVGVEMQRWAASLTSRLKRHELGRHAAETVAARLGRTCWFAVHDPARHRLVYVAEAPAGEEGPRTIHPGAIWGLADAPPGWAVLACLSAEARAEALSGAPRAVRTAVAAATKRGYAADAAGRLAVAVLDGRRLPVGALCLDAAADGPALPEAAAALAEAAASLSERMAGRILPGVRGTAPHALMDVARRARQHLPDLPDIGLDGSDLRNMERLGAIDDGNAGYCAVTLDRTEAAFLGRPPFTRPHPRLRLMMTLMPLHLHVLVRADSPFLTLGDLVGARVSPGERSYVTAEVWRSLLGLLAPKAATRHRAEARLVDLDYADANQAFLDGTVDALVSLNQVPVPAYVTLAAQVPVRLLGLDPALVAAFRAEHPMYAQGVIPGGSYPVTDADVLTLETPLGMVTSADRSEAEVRRMIEAIRESRNAGTGGSIPWPAPLAVPIHPGAIG
jgi:TRAP transporter TAXI family solute receptor